MKKRILAIAAILLSGCSTSNITVIPPEGAGELHITVNQGREVPFTLQGNVPVQGGTVTNPAQNMDK